MKTDMGTGTVCTASSVAEATRVLLDLRDPRLCVRHSASDDVAPLLLAKASLLAAGGERVCVVCADEAAALRYRRQLPAFVGLVEEDVTTMRGLCSRVLAREEIQKALRRGMRVLDDNECDLLLEDLKTSGVRPRRLREMLKFFFRSFSCHTDEGEDWLLTAEERGVFALFEENMRMRQAVLPCEMARLACRGLQASDAGSGGIAGGAGGAGGAAATQGGGTSRMPSPTGGECEGAGGGGCEGARIPVVAIGSTVAVVDGYDTLSRASQRLLDLLFPERLIVAGSASGTQSAAEPYPNPDGLLSFCETHVGAGCIELVTDRAPVDEACIAYADPAAEFAGVADAVAARLAAGCAPCDVLVAVPNPVWGRRMAAALAQRGVEAAVDGGPVRLEGDPRDSGRCGRLRLAAFLRLLLDPRDFVSLRSWLGFGDWLLRSDAVLDLMAFAQGQGLDMEAALAVLQGQSPAQRPFASFEKLEGPLRELDELRCACADIDREGAVALFARHGMALDERMVGLLGADPDHADVRGLARHAFETPDVPDGDSLVIAPYRRCCGRHVRVTFLTGLVNGFLPTLDAVDDRYTVDHRERALGRERQLFDAVRATADEALACSYFQSDRAENAAVLDMQAVRLFVRGDVRYAKAAPSVFLPSA